MPKVSVTVLEDGQEVWSDVASLPLEVGRQRNDDSGLLQVQNLGNCFRLAIAPISTITLPREALRIESDHEFLKLTNIHSKLSFLVGDDATPLTPGQSFEAQGEITVVLPEQRMVRFSRGHENEMMPLADSIESSEFRPLQTVTQSTLENLAPAKLGELFGDDEDTDRGRVAVELVRQALTVVQEAAGSDKFFDSAVRSAANMIDLDRSFVILKEGENWRVRSRFLRDDAMATTDSARQSKSIPTGSGKLLEQVRQTALTVIYEPNTYDHTAGSSMMSLERAVAAPIVDEDKNVIGVLYGDRKFGSSQADTPIGELEATLLEVIAGAVSSGLARQRQEAIRASMTQFFSPSVTERLEHNEDLLTGRDADVSVLFCDIRGFSGITERVGAQRAIEWINDVLTELSQCVMRTDGVLVDYVGDELMAMWGAPADQPDHAVRACKAAIDMLSLIDPLRERWSDITSDRFGFGIGINTGIARVGNTGSKVKFKYGPLGNTVNVASRIQGITKKLGVSALISDSTAKEIDRANKKFKHRRLAVVRPLGVEESVTVHELKADADNRWQNLSMRYEKALDLFHQSDLTGAARELASLVHEHPGDTPSVVLLGRVVQSLTAKSENVDPVMAFDSK